MKLFRKIIFWCHLTAGVFAGTVVLIMSVTGVLLTYERQITSWADTRNYKVTQSATAQNPLAIEELLAKFRDVQPDATVSSITKNADTHLPVSLTIAGGRTFFVNPYTGEVFGEGSKSVHNFFRSVTDWHRWLAASGENRSTGRAITGACNLAFLFLVMSGFYLWFPKNLKWAQVKNILWFKRGLPAKARDFNWHNVMGFWSAIPLFIVVLSGVVISYAWAGNLVYRLVGETPPQQQRPQAPVQPGTPANQPNNQVTSSSPVNLYLGLNDKWGQAEKQVAGWQSISLRLPTSVEAPLVFSIDQGNGGQPQNRGTLTLNNQTGEVIKWEPFSTNTPGRKLRSILRFAHTGEVLGILGQTLAGLVSALSAVLVYTGLALSFRRLRAWLSRRQQPSRSSSPVAEIAVTNIRSQSES